VSTDWFPDMPDASAGIGPADIGAAARMSDLEDALSLVLIADIDRLTPTDAMMLRAAAETVRTVRMRIL
jgi:hypothetical protein